MRGVIFIGFNDHLDERFTWTKNSLVANNESHWELEKHNSKFSEIKKFSPFPGFCSELQSPFEKTETTESYQFGWMLTYFVAVCFLKPLIMFWKSFFRLVLSRYFISRIHIKHIKFLGFILLSRLVFKRFFYIRRNLGITSKTTIILIIFWDFLMFY